MTSRTQPSLLPVDHVIFYAGFELGLLGDFFERIGFTLTPLGRHATGSVNRLVMLQDSYLELIGFEPGTPSTVRPELQACQPSLNGIAFRGEPSLSWGADRLARFNPVFDLQRPVDTDTVSGLARFRITTLRQGPKDFRLFLCAHVTPELLWHQPWMRHANGVTGVTCVQAACEGSSAFWAALTTVASRADQPQQGGAFCEGGTEIRLADAAEPNVVTLASRDLRATAQCLSDAGVTFCRNGSGALLVEVPGLESAQLMFVQGGPA